MIFLYVSISDPSLIFISDTKDVSFSYLQKSAKTYGSLTWNAHGWTCSTHSENTMYVLMGQLLVVGSGQSMGPRLRTPALTSGTLRAGTALTDIGISDPWSTVPRAVAVTDKWLLFQSHNFLITSNWLLIFICWKRENVNKSWELLLWNLVCAVKLVLGQRFSNFSVLKNYLGASLEPQW